MFDYFLFQLMVAVGLILFILLMIRFCINTWCDSCNKDEKADYSASWNNITFPHHDTFTIAPLPPYFFVNGVIGYDKFSTMV